MPIGAYYEGNCTLVQYLKSHLAPSAAVARILTHTLVGLEEPEETVEKIKEILYSIGDELEIESLAKKTNDLKFGRVPKGVFLVKTFLIYRDKEWNRRIETMKPITEREFINSKHPLSVKVGYFLKKRKIDYVGYILFRTRLDETGKSIEFYFLAMQTRKKNRL